MSFKPIIIRRNVVKLNILDNQYHMLWTDGQTDTVLLKDIAAVSTI